MLQQVQLLPHRLEEAVCPCSLQVPLCHLPHWLSLLLTFSLRAAVITPLVSRGTCCSPFTAPQDSPVFSRLGMLLASLPGAKTACLCTLHGTGKPGDFLSCGHGSAVASQVPWEVGYEVRSSSFILIFSFHSTCTWVKWSVNFKFCILNFKQGRNTPWK